jgi:hypothetical protein
MTWDIPEQDLDHSSECLPELNVILVWWQRPIAGADSGGGG